MEVIPTNRNPHTTSHLFGKPAAEATSVPGNGRWHWPSPGVPARVPLGALLLPAGLDFPREATQGQAGDESPGRARGAGG